MLDIISKNVKRIGSSYISKPLSMLFNNSLQTCTVPSEWKVAYIAPIHKKKR